MKKKAFNFFATVAVKKYVYVDDMMTPVDTENMAYASAFEIQERLNKHRVRIETMLNEINTRTKAHIIQSILGLGQIYRQQ
eukprot:8357426-Heterocapsa_arctica.AAC.1